MKDIDAVLKLERIRRVIIASVIIAVIVIIILFIGHTASWKRTAKSFRSNVGNGLERTVTVYDYNGKPIKSWTGKFDVSESETEVYFDDENGKRTIIHGGIVINQEN